jgi:hypothetical protein
MAAMDDLERIKKHHGGPHGPNHQGTPTRQPYWRRMHRSPFFWIAAFFIMLAMVIFVMTDGLLFRPRDAPVRVSGP